MLRPQRFQRPGQRQNAGPARQQRRHVPGERRAAQPPDQPISPYGERPVVREMGGELASPLAVRVKDRWPVIPIESKEWNEQAKGQDADNQKQKRMNSCPARFNEFADRLHGSLIILPDLSFSGKFATCYPLCHSEASRGVRITLSSKKPKFYRSSRTFDLNFPRPYCSPGQNGYMELLQSETRRRGPRLHLSHQTAG